MPQNDDNLIVRALRLLQSRTGCDFGMDISLDKRIPIQAGLGGASSDAATALVAGNRLWDLGLDSREISGIAAELGSDIPFFLTGGTAICRGRGEKVEVIDAVNSLPLLLVRPPIGLSTPEVFGHCRVPDQPRTCVGLIDSFRTRNLSGIRQNMLNRLEPAASHLTDWIERLRKSFDALNCVGHQLSGSGSCYFGLFSNHKLLRNAAARLLQREPDIALYCCRHVGRMAHHFPDFSLGGIQTSPQGMA